MSKRVIVVASGETERRSLPHLLAHLESEDIVIDSVRIPPGGRALNVEMAEKLVKSAWYEYIANPPDKFVVLVDVDGKIPDDVLRQLTEPLPSRLGAKIKAVIQFAYAQWHLEAWYFADAAGLRKFLGRDLGSADTSKPDEIMDPKRHLKNLLGDQQLYTAVVSEEIAKSLNAETVAQRSPSFDGFLDAVRNGNQERIIEE